LSYDRTIEFTVSGRPYSIVVPECPLAVTVAMEIIQGQSYPVFTWMKDVRTIVDVGASFGPASLFFAAVWPKATIRAYEPDTDSCDFLIANTKGQNVEVHNYAIGDRYGAPVLYQGRLGAACNSLVRQPGVTDRGETVPMSDARAAFRFPIDILKIDTEGMEVPILKRIADRLGEIRFLYLEFHSAADRLEFERILSPTHDLHACRMQRPHTGEVLYVRKGEWKG